MEGLKPCPFCGGEADYLPDVLVAPGADPAVFCDSCHASAMDATHWNTRPEPPRQTVTAEEVAETIYADVRVDWTPDQNWHVTRIDAAATAVLAMLREKRIIE